MVGEKDLNMALLLDFYGAMLTEKQQDIIDLYYNQDLSLGEISEHAGITRQGVRDCIKRGEQTMSELEEKLMLHKKYDELEDIADELERIAGKDERFGAEIMKLSAKLREIL